MVLRGIHGKVDISQTDYSTHSKLKIFFFWSHTSKYNIQTNEGFTKFKEKLSAIKFDVFVFCFIFFFLSMSQAISVISRNGTCYVYTHQTSCVCADVCVCNRTHQMESDVEKLAAQSLHLPANLLAS